MSNTIRTFIALNLSQELKNKISLGSKELQKMAGSNNVRWLESGNIHITLKFLGETPKSLIPAITEITENAVLFPSPAINIGGLGAFPSLNKPRVIWIGLNPSKELIDLYRYFQNELSGLGFEKEARSFKPHLTLGRIKRFIDTSELRELSKNLKSFQFDDLGVHSFRTVTFFESQLSKKGATYHSLKMINLS